jgi:predicted AAA+ superfamily ATPase
MRPDRGELWENSVFRTLADKYDFDAILYWRTTAGNEVDFVLPGINKPRAIEARFDRIRLNPLKYKIFTETYPDIPIEYVWMSPFDEDFFRRFM